MAPRIRSKLGIQNRNLIDVVRSAWPLSEWADDNVVVGVSGGPDSMFLLETLYRLTPQPDRLIVVHCNHRQRGEESDADEVWVSQQAALRGLECLAYRLDDTQRQDSSEDGLRKARHMYLRRAARERGAKWIALGHHADDSIETFLQRMLRGTGPKGLAGIPARRQYTDSIDDENRVLIRPLLSVYRQEIFDWLRCHDIPFRVDSSNDDPRYYRNRQRLELIPVLDKLGGATWREHLLATMKMMAEQAEETRRDAMALFTMGTTEASSELQRYQTALANLLNTRWSVIREMLVIVWMTNDWPLREMSHMHWSRIKRAIEKGNETPHPIRLDLPSHVRLTIRKRQFAVERTGLKK